MATHWIRLGRAAATVLVSCLFLLALNALFRLASEEPPPTYSPEELRKVEDARNVGPHLTNGVRLQVDVDYSEGAAAAWYPRKDPPLLAPLVKPSDMSQQEFEARIEERVADGTLSMETGELAKANPLPPVAERVGPEPLVYRGVDGIGSYGGTRVRPGSINRLNWTMSACTWVRWSPGGFPVVPHVAREFEVSNDYKEYTFYLRRGMRWSDGHPFTTDDVMYWWNHECLEKKLSPVPPWHMKINDKYGHVEKIDDYTVKFVFPEPNGLFMMIMAGGSGTHGLDSPAHYLRKYHPVLGDKDFLEEEIRKRQLLSAQDLYKTIKHPGNTEHPRLWPWLYRSYKSSPPFSVVRNPYYFMVDTEGNQLPYIDRQRMIESARDMLPARAVSGEFPFITFKPIEYTLLMSGRERGGYDVYRWFRIDRSDAIIHPNQNRRIDPDKPETKKKNELLNDVRFRMALSLALDREEIVAANYHNETVPGQVAPGPYSAFHRPGIMEAFAERDLDEANRLLDEIGLSQRDREGYRTFRDGSRMVFYIDHVSWITPTTIQFIADSWADVGIRAIPRMRDNRLFWTELIAREHDFTMFTGENEYIPIMSPRSYVFGTYFASAYNKWIANDGKPIENTVGAKNMIRPPDWHPMFRVHDIYEQVKATGDLAKQKELFGKVLDIASSNVWTIGICTAPHWMVLVRNDLKNVPKHGAYGTAFMAPGNMGQETWYMDPADDDPVLVDNSRQEILRTIPQYTDEAADAEDAAAVRGNRLGWLIKTLFKLVASCCLVLACVRRPYIARRLLIMVPTLFVISIIVFITIELPPGDFLSAKIMTLQENGDLVQLEEIQKLRDLYHLDEPVPVRYARWLGLYWFAGFDEADQGLLQGNLGRSMSNDNREVNALIGDRIVLNVILSLSTILLTWAIAIPLGIYSAVRQYSIGDYILTFIAFLGMCVPGFLLALILMFLSRVLFGVDVSGLYSPEYALQPYWSWGKVLDLIKHIWVPLFIMAAGSTAGMIRVMRANLLDELNKPYVTTARAKGVRPLRLLLKYPVRMALNPFMSGIGGILPALLSGSALIAIVLSLPTIGPLMLTALMMEDTILAGSMLMVYALLGVLGVLISDLVLLWVDPRIRYEKGSR